MDRPPTLVTSEGHLVFPLTQGLDSLSPLLPVRRPIPRRPAPQPPVRPPPPTTPIPEPPSPPTPSERSLSPTPTPEEPPPTIPTPSIGRLTLRLIDDDGDTITDTDDDSRCDSFQGLIEFPQRPFPSTERQIMGGESRELSQATHSRPFPTSESQFTGGESRNVPQTTPSRPLQISEAQIMGGDGRGGHQLAHSRSFPASQEQLMGGGSRELPISTHSRSFPPSNQQYVGVESRGPPISTPSRIFPPSEERFLEGDSRELPISTHSRSLPSTNQQYMGVEIQEQSLSRPYPPTNPQYMGGRGLTHSASDPGVARRLRMGRPAQQLHQLSEEEDDRTATAQNTGVRCGRLARQDSAVAIPEDLLHPRPSLAGVAALALVGAALWPGTAMLLHAAFRMVFGTLFPAYYSYKAVKTKNVKEYVKWMMYWIVFAFFTSLETLTDIFLSFWFPFYYEIKILVVLWLLSPATRGSSILYRKFVHPWLTQREEDIDNCIAQARQQGYSAVLSLGSRGVNYATNVIMQTAIKGGGGLVNQLRRSYSSGELMGDDGDLNRNIKPLPPHLSDPDYDDPHHRAPPPGTPPTPYHFPHTPPSTHFPSPADTTLSPVSFYASASPQFTPLHAGVELEEPYTPPVTRQRVRQQQRQQQQQQQRQSRVIEEEVLEKEELD